MFKEEKIIGGRLYYRTDPDGEWKLYTEADLITKYQHMNNSFYSAMDQIKGLEAANQKLRLDLVAAEGQATKLEAENRRLKEALEGIISCAENVRVTYADTNQLIIDMARQARKGAGDE
ncbi:hypothetical protein [Rhodobacteraceae phage LS06-2018-MD07]|jgi:hypothetical protein|nr:hypothetical protein [Rhodobacteraceae phage LS06-2018-MD07]